MHVPDPGVAGEGEPEQGGEGASERAGGARMEHVSLLFVCLGNICRSPTAEGVMRALVADAGLRELVELDSAGTGAWHVGSAPDARASEAAAARGIVLEGTARKVRVADFEEFDLILAMDRANLRDLRDVAPDEHARAKVRLLREFDPACRAGAGDGAGKAAGKGAGDGELEGLGDGLDVPDPYYGGPGGFEQVLDLVQAACVGLLAELRAPSP